MRISLIITTYNWKEALDLVLESVARQIELPHEVLVADDGSRADTAELLERWAQRLPCPLRHIWQEDRGFRVGRIRNRAIAAARGDYVVLVDGDMVLHPAFIADHRAAARPGSWTQGVRARTGPETARRMLAQQLTWVGFFTRGIERRRHLVRSQILRWLLSRPHRSERGIHSCNQGFWRADLLRVNGFDEQMTGWGYEDGELASRLYHCGITRRDLRFHALALHLHHPSRRCTVDNPNLALMRRTRAQCLVRCELGLDQHLVELATPGRAPGESTEGVPPRGAG